jgi:hypothetical protein
VIGVVGVILLKSMATYRPAVLPPATPVQAAEARAAVAEARETISEISKAAERGKKEPFDVQLKDEHLTTYMATDKRIKARLMAEGLRDPRVRFESGRVIVSGFKTYHGKEAYVTVSGKPTAGVDGRVKLAGISVKVGKLNAPMLASKAEKMLDDMFRSGETKLPANVKQITAQNGELHLRGVSRPE